MKGLSTLIFVFLTLPLFITAQTVNFWADMPESTFEKQGIRQIIPQSYRTVTLDTTSLRQILSTVPFEKNISGSSTKIFLPMPNGTFERFAIVNAPIMESSLAVKFPTIQTFIGKGIDNPSASVRLDWTYKGFHAMILSSAGTVFIDPYDNQTKTNYIAYYKKDFTKNVGFDCYEEEAPSKINPSAEHLGQKFPNGTLKTYRLAMSCTGEYAQFHGGTVMSAMSAMVTTMNRVNGVYEIEVGVRMIFVANNDQLIFLNGANDPFDNNGTFVIVNQNQTVIDNTIGSANYDIGHVVSTGGGGFAPGNVCQNNQKARAVTGLPSPVGDPFDIDYVAHEMGHQFTGSHIFNGSSGSCSNARVGSAAYEPGSGTTIMGYAGICPGQNIQNNSDPYFNTYNFDQIVTYTEAGTGSTCAVVTPTGNNDPVVDAGTGGYIIPKNTPFELIGSAIDPDGDPMTFCWEQHDLGPQGNPNQPQGNAPIFRSFPPVNTPSRTFPQISDLVNNIQTLGEILPAYARTMNFRLTARDNVAGGGGVSYDGITVIVADVDPFVVTAPNTGNEVWTEGSIATVTWNAGGTPTAPINCDSVDILLSLDGGFTYPITLATSVPNTGTHLLNVPIGTATTTARVRVQGAGRIFFDISNQDFTIEQPTSPDFIPFVENNTATVCAGTDITFSLDLISLLNYNDPVNLSVTGLPAGATVEFNANPALPGSTVSFTIKNAATTSTGYYPLTLNLNSTIGTKTVNFETNIYSLDPPAVNILLPEEGARNVITSVLLKWENPGNLGHTYDLQVATDPQFINLFEEVNDLSDTTYIVSNLLPNSVYYWRVKANNFCTTGNYTELRAFRTINTACDIYTGATVKNISGAVTFTFNSELTVNNNVTISDVNVLNVRMNHNRISDISLALQSPAGTTVDLLPRVCPGNVANMDINFDDAALNANYPCPPIGGGTFQPLGNLLDFQGESSEGVWQMLITDNQQGVGGVFSNYDLEICYVLPNTNEDPVLVNNKTMSGVIGQNTAIRSTELLATDTDNTTDELTFTLLSTPSNGQVVLNNVVLEIGGIFTQADIDAGLVTYQHLGTAAEQDSFKFHITDGAGGFYGSPYFVIDVNTQIIIDEQNGVVIYPNPVSDILTVGIALVQPEPVNIWVIDALGRIVHEAQFTNLPAGFERYEIDVTTFAEGMYFVKVQSDSIQVVEPILIVH